MANIASNRARRITSAATSSRVSRVRRPAATPDKAGPDIAKLKVKEDIVKSLIKTMPRIPNLFRDGDYLHVSDVIHKCLRKIALSKSMGMVPPGKGLRDSEQITFDTGTAIHNFVRARMTEHQPHSIYGRWKCMCGHTVTPPMVYSKVSAKHECEECGFKPNHYEELDVKDDEYGVSGSPDMLLWVRELEALHVTEIKSIAGDKFDELLRPVPDHIIQVVFYWHLLKRAGIRITDHVSILYVSKAYSFKDIYKEFVIDAAKEEKRLTPYIDDVLTYIEHKKNSKKPLPHRACPTPSSPDAKDCHVRVSCFQL